jgi:hypothetical protein
VRHLPDVTQLGIGIWTHHSDLLARRSDCERRSVGLPGSQVAVGGFSEALAQEVTPLGIKVTVLEPGGMRTDLCADTTADSDTALTLAY